MTEYLAKWRFIAVCLLMSALARAEAPPAPAETLVTSNDVELLYVEALLAYHRKEYPDTLRMLDTALKQQGDNLKALELRALVLRATNDYPKSLQAYQALLHLAIERKLKARFPPYVFSIGVLYLLMKDYVRSQLFLEKALTMGFHPPVCHYFLGIIQLKKRDGDFGEAHFAQVKGAGDEELHSPSDLQLAQIAVTWRDTGGAIRDLLEARARASALLQQPTFAREGRALQEGVITLADRALGKIDRAVFFGSLSLVSEYDSNLLYLPTNAPSGVSTVEELLQLGVGIETSPLKDAQLIAVYRGAGNYVFSAVAREAQFMLHDVATYFILHPSSPLRIGLKLAAAYSLQDAQAPDGSGSSYRPFELSGSFGPYLRMDIAPRWTLGADLLLTPQKYYLDPQVAAPMRLSGMGEELRVFVRQEGHRRYWNPELALMQSYQHTDGEEFRNVSAGAEASDRMQLGASVTLQPKLALELVDYGSRLSGGKRLDTRASLDIAAAFRVASQLEVSADVRALENLSNVSEYHYTHVVLSGGLSYVF